MKGRNIIRCFFSARILHNKFYSDGGGASWVSSEIKFTSGSESSKFQADAKLTEKHVNCWQTLLIVLRVFSSDTIVKRFEMIKTIQSPKIYQDFFREIKAFMKHPLEFR